MEMLEKRVGSGFGQCTFDASLNSQTIRHEKKKADRCSTLLHVFRKVLTTDDEKSVHLLLYLKDSVPCRTPECAAKETPFTF